MPRTRPKSYLEDLIQVWMKEHRAIDRLNEKGGGKNPKRFEELVMEHGDTSHRIAMYIAETFYGKVVF